MGSTGVQLQAILVVGQLDGILRVCEQLKHRTKICSILYESRLDACLDSILDVMHISIILIVGSFPPARPPR